MNNSFFKIFKGDAIVWIIFFLLIAISALEMFSASSYLVSVTGSISGPIIRHLMFFVAGFVLILITMLVPLEHVRMLGYIGLVISWILLCFVLIKGGEGQSGNSARSIDIMGVAFQPSEIARVSIIIVIADFIHRYQNFEYKGKMFIIYSILIGITCGLIFPENLSTALIIFLITMTMMFIGGVYWKYITMLGSVLVGAALLIIVISTSIPDDVYDTSNNGFIELFERAHTWVARIDNHYGSETDKFTITDSNRQISHAQMAIASSGIIGCLPGNSVQSNFLPEAFSDFIFAIVVEELGWVGVILLIIIYLVLLYRAGAIARKSTKVFCSILVIGITLIIVLQAFIHMGVSTGIGPVTGQPLPLVSRGGMSTLVTCIYFGLILSVSHNLQKEIEQEQQAADEDSLSIEEERIEIVDDEPEYIIEEV